MLANYPQLLAALRKSTLCRVVPAILCVNCVVYPTATLRAQIQVGLAQADITPPIGGRTAGYESAQPTEGVHDPLSARVVLLKSHETTIALVSCDLCVFNHAELHQQVAELGIDRLVFSNTHTHAGPKMDEDFPSAAEPWSKTLGQRVLAAIKQAQRSMFQGYFAASESQIQLGYNRLIQRGDYALTYFENPERIPYGSVDTQVGVIRITNEQGEIKAVLVNYACHPVVLGPKNVKLSADYPGVMRRAVEENVGKGALCVFFQGGAGDINPLFLARGSERQQDFDTVENMGTMLAAEVSRALSFIDAVDGKSEAFSALSSTTVFKHRFEPEQSVELGVSTLLINHEIVIITMPGEPFHKFAIDIREKSNLNHVYLFGYSSNADYPWPAYLPDLVSAARGGYGASQNTNAEVGAGEKLMNDGLVQLFKLQGRLKPTPIRNTFEVEPK